jgi:hypothetical protein
MARGKSNKLAPWQKLVTIMVTGKPVTVDEIEATLGNEIYMYKLSTYMWCIKTDAGGVIKVMKEGRKAVAYQIMNVKEVKEYMNRVGITKSGYAPGGSIKTPSVCKIAKLADLKAVPVVAVDSPVVEVKPEPVSEKLEVTEITNA